MIAGGLHLEGLEEIPPVVSLEICESHLRQQCNSEPCSSRHCSLPYQWQIGDFGDTWIDLALEQNAELELAFCKPSNDGWILEFTHENIPVRLAVSFDSLSAICSTPNSADVKLTVRRLSTPSYASSRDAVMQGGAALNRFVTQWRWYFCSGHDVWRPFGEPIPIPQQCTVEAKYLHGQPLYRFEWASEGDFIIDMRPDRMNMRNLLKNDATWLLRRRPVFFSPASTLPLPWPSMKPTPFAASMPDSWCPVDTEQEYEMIPLDPGKLVYGVIGDFFHETMLRSSYKILDIFRVQNPFLWHKYSSKRQQMQLRRERQPESQDYPLEVQLFHGTRSEQAVQAIMLQNFDWRISGTANDVVYGHGAYFAQEAQFSGRYADSNVRSRRSWMFLARVLVGQCAVGRREFVRPPPIDPLRPHGELFDSCVNDLKRRKIYVIFDSDQCYPEYLISYIKS